jgi:hypothetical protein
MCQVRKRSKCARLGKGRDRNTQSDLPEQELSPKPHQPLCFYFTAGLPFPNHLYPPDEERAQQHKGFMLRLRLGSPEREASASLAASSRMLLCVAFLLWPGVNCPSGTCNPLLGPLRLVVVVMVVVV